jgi:hypothetical protein
LTTIVEEFTEDIATIARLELRAERGPDHRTDCDVCLMDTRTTASAE